MTKPKDSAVKTGILFLKNNWFLIGIFSAVIGTAWKVIIIPQVKAVVVEVTASGYHPSESDVDLKIRKIVDEKIDKFGRDNDEVIMNTINRVCRIEDVLIKR